ncbi:acyl-CoA reductase, partial [Actinosynnema sp. NPDC023658]
MSVSWMPEWLVADGVPFTLKSGPHEWRGVRPADWTAVGEGLRTAHEDLRRLPVRRIVEALDAVADLW